MPLKALMSRVRSVSCVWSWMLPTGCPGEISVLFEGSNPLAVRK